MILFKLYLSKSKFLLAVVLLLCFVVEALAQQSVTKDPIGIDILDQVFRPTRTATALIHDSIAEGQLQMWTGENGTIRITTQGSRRLRYEIILPNRHFTSVVKDGKGFRVDGDAKKNFPSWTTAYRSTDHIPMLSRITEYADRDVKIVDLATKIFAGRLCHEVRLSVQPEDEKIASVEDFISELHVFIDAQTLEIVGTRGFFFSPEAIENRSPVDRVYSDYRVIDGVPIPFRVEQYVSGKLDSVITWTSIQLNTGVPNNVFD